MNIDIEIFRICAIGFGSLAAVFLIIAGILFFKLKIPYVIGELRGNIKSISIQVKEQENKKKNDNLTFDKMPENNLAPIIKQKAEIDKDEDEEENFTKPLELDNKIFEDFKIIKNIVFVNTREEVKL